MDGMNWAKKGWEMLVTVIDFWDVQVVRARYSCSAAANVARYQGCGKVEDQHD